MTLNFEAYCLMSSPDELQKSLFGSDQNLQQLKFIMSLLSHL